MIFTGFKRKSNQIFFNKRLAKLLEKQQKTSSNKVKKVLIIVDDFSNTEFIKQSLIENVGILNEHIEVIAFQNRIPKKNTFDELISPKDFGWYGKIKSDKLKTILTNTYDLLINYSKIETIYTNLLLLQSKTDFKVGFAHLNNQLYDFVIDCKPDEIEIFNKELKKYLKIFNKID